MGLEGRPPVPPPKALAPLMGFAKRPPTALAVVRRVLDADEDFRRRVAAVVPDDADIDSDVDRAGWLFLHRPDGWVEEAAALEAAWAEQHALADAARSDRAASRRITGLEATVKRVKDELDDARAAADRARTELATERQQRRAAEERGAAMSRRVESLEGERDAARRRAADAATENQRLAGIVAELEARLAQHAVSEGVEAELRRQLEDLRNALETSESSAAGDRAAAGRAVAEAAATLEALRTALAEAALALGLAPATPAAPVPPAEAATASRRPARTRTRRRPQPLPPAVLDDSPEAAEHLVRTPGALVLVDGYNATLAAWGALSIADQRARLVDAASELSARTGAEIHIVFDGAEQPGGVSLPGQRRAVRWSFSPPDVEADDVLLAMVDQADPARPVVVASSDGRVRDGVRDRGANAITTPQLFAVLRRELR